MHLKPHQLWTSRAEKRSQQIRQLRSNTLVGGFGSSDTDIRSKDVFGAVMLLFSISDIGFKGNGPIVTVPANG
jgi:hypothetical protein